MERAWLVAASALAAFLVLMCYLLQKQLLRLHNQATDAALVLPLCRTLGDLLSTSKERSAMLEQLENTRFRSISIAVFSPEGEVFMDTTAPCASRKHVPVPSSQRQREVHRLLVDRKVLETPAGVSASLFRSCHPAGGPSHISSVAGVVTEDKTMVIAVTACGAETI